MHINENVNTDDLLILRSIAYIYLVCSHLVDTDFTAEEKQAVVIKIHQWLPVGDEELAMEALQQAIDLYHHRETVQEKLVELQIVADLLKANLSLAQLTNIIYDLITIVNADGKVSAPETDFIAATGKTFGIHIE